MPRLLLLALAIAGLQSSELLTLEIRVFRGSEDVTTQTRITVHRAGERSQPVSQSSGRQGAKIRVPPGLYDAQAVQEQDSRVVNIRWAERLVVMPYPDEDGHHLEVINFTPGYGALQVRAGAGTAVDQISLFASSDRSQAVATASGQGPYALFVVRAGVYDLEIARGARKARHASIEIPLDRTRLWIVP